MYIDRISPASRISPAVVNGYPLGQGEMKSLAN
jgi:hypothetical protein